MSRSGYCETLGPLETGRWRAQVASAMRGKRGQAMFKDLVAALDAMPQKELITDELESDGKVCALGALGRFRGIDMSGIDPEEPEYVASVFNVAHQLAREIVYENDEAERYSTPEQRWANMRAWAMRRIRVQPEEANA